ncbi:MAG: ChaN family lipoprotein [Alkalilacustris sp.]
MRVLSGSVAAGLAAMISIGAAAALTPTEIPPADIVILGEVHDNADHHRWQAEAVAALRPAALVFEMLLADQAEAVTADLRGDAEALGAALGWEARGWPDFAMYHPIFTAAPEAVVVGGDVPREDVRLALSDGAAAVFARLFEDDPARFGLDAPLPADEQAEREALQGSAHCDALPEAVLPGMVEAQRLRDAALARAAIRAMEDTGGPVVVIAGTGHARRDWGVPAALAVAAPDLTVISVGQLEGPAQPEPPFDLVRRTPPAEREDPCAAFH